MAKRHVKYAHLEDYKASKDNLEDIVTNLSDELFGKSNKEKILSLKQEDTNGNQEQEAVNGNLKQEAVNGNQVQEKSNGQ